MEVCTYSWTVFFFLDVSESKGLLAHRGQVRFYFIPRASIFAIGRFYIAILLPL